MSCKRFNRNRALLTKLVYDQKGFFTVEEIITEFSRQQKGDIIIDGIQTIAQHIKELADLGAIIREGHGFRARTFAPRL